MLGSNRCQRPSPINYQPALNCQCGVEHIEGTGSKGAGVAEEVQPPARGLDARAKHCHIRSN